MSVQQSLRNYEVAIIAAARRVVAEEQIIFFSNDEAFEGWCERF